MIQIRRRIIELQTETGNPIYMEFIKTKSGIHIISAPFNLQKFREEFPDIDVHKDNPTILYIS